MLGFFGGNKSDHPLGSLKTIQQQLDALPRTDPVTVLEEIGHWIEALFDDENEFRPDHQFAALRLLDDTAHPYLRKITQTYFAATPPAVFQENRLWGALYAYYTFTELGHVRLLQAMRNGDKGSAALKPSAALICARGIYAVWGRMECAAVRYSSIDHQLWVHLADCYDYAAMSDVLADEMQLYPGSFGDSTVDRMFASVVIWYSIGVGAMKPLDLHICRCLVMHARKFFTVSEEPQPGSMFIFDLAHPLDPARARDDGAMYPPSTRFVSMGVPAGYFEGMLKTLAKDLIPDGLNFGVEYSPAIVADVVNRVAAYSKLPLPSRRHQRRKMQMQVKILSGYAKVIEQSEAGLSFNAESGEACVVEDISATGMKYIMPAGSKAQVNIGTLVGLQPENAAHWGAGIVRRLRRDAYNQLHVGIRILANKVSGVVLHDGTDGMGNGQYPALIIERSDESSGESWLMVRSETFSINRSPKMTVGEQEFLMLPVGVIEKGDEFDLVRYRKMAHEEGGEDPY